LIGNPFPIRRSGIQVRSGVFYSTNLAAGGRTEGRFAKKNWSRQFSFLNITARVAMTLALA
jgi:hypothetical protein